MKTQLILATYFTLLLAIAGCGGPAETSGTLGAHTLTVVDTSGGPLGGSSGGRTDADGNEIDTFESANGRYKVMLKDDVLTINGDEYTLDKPGSEIRIVDAGVEINGLAVSPNTK